MDDYSKYIHVSRYARWRDDLCRRETYEETIDRYIDNLVEPHCNKALSKEIKTAIMDMKVMPSMRALMTAGKALDRDNVAGYNCSYLQIDRVRAFDEMMYVLMCGTGVGFSVERQFINKLPEVAEEFTKTDTVIHVRDSKIGWASAFRELLSLLYNGRIPSWDVSRVRPKGSRLKTFGGRASGPEPLLELFNFAVNLMLNARGRRLNSIECHDLCCKIADIVVVGGVRRSALISLSNLTDERMRKAKHGQWWEENGQRALANNSVAYTEKPDVSMFMKEGRSLYESKSGERGIFSREASKIQAERNGRRDSGHDFGTNPCSEIILRDRQFCNLTEVVIRPTDSLEDLKTKVRLATILGTLQSTKTDFRYLSKKWRENTEEERLLGVSMTGIMDHPILSKDRLQTISWLYDLREVAVATNKEWAKKLGINQSTAITCVKPSGTVSQLVDSASGIHPRYSEFYIRTVRNDMKDPVTQFLIDQGVPHEPAIGKEGSTMVFSFPMRAPKDSVHRDDMTAIEQLDLWKVYQEHWCEHKPSITVYVREHEWLDVLAWVYKHFDMLSGVSFLPHTDHTYAQAPYQEITEEQYNEAVANMKPIDWSKLANYESEDLTTGSQELACVAGACEI